MSTASRSSDEPYDILLDDFEPEMKTAEVRAIFDEIKAGARPLIAELRDREVDDSFLRGDFPIDAPGARSTTRSSSIFGYRPNSWRLDPTEHPFASGAGIDDIRITTNYYPKTMKSLFSTMHEYGHGLYSHQLPREYERPPGRAAHVARHPRVAEQALGEPRRPQPAVLALLLSALAGDVSRTVRRRRRRPFYAGINRRKPSLISIKADEVTYGMHIILRFELEQDIINGRVELETCRRSGRADATTTSAWRSPTTRTASSRTCTGLPA